MLKAREVLPPSTSLVAPLYADADFVDAYSVQLPMHASHDIELLARVGFEKQAWWIRALTCVRDLVMASVGVKSSRAVGAVAAKRGPVIGFFPLLSKTSEELVLGEDDKHLNFRLALLRRSDSAGGKELVVVTVVHCHNWLGRTYIAAIKPLHRVIARASLEQIARRA